MPINPPAPPPSPTNRAKIAVRAAVKRHANALDIIALGLALGVLCALAGLGLAVALAVPIIFTLGAVAEAALGSK